MTSISAPQILITVVLLSLFIVHKFGGKASVDFSQVVMALAALVAIATFFLEQSRHKSLSAVENLAFFRKEILEDLEGIATHLKSLKGINLSKLRSKNIERFEYTWLPNNSHDAYVEQLKMHRFLNERDVLRMLNKLEEFSLRAIHTDTVDHPALEATKDAYVQIVEQFAVYIFLQRANPDIKTFEGIAKIYIRWKDQVSRLTQSEILEILKERVRQDIKEGKVPEMEKILVRIRQERAVKSEAYALPTE